MRLGDHQLYHSCEADLRSLIRSGVRDGVIARDADDICTLIERQLGIVIHRYPASLGGHPYGLLLRGQGFCILLYERHTSAWHQAAIKLHELAHILYNHRGTEDGTTAALRVLVPDIPAGQLSTILRRTGEEDGHRPEDERQAEAFSTVGLAWFGDSQAQGRGHAAIPQHAAPPDDPTVAGVVRRLLDDFAGG